MQTGRWSRWNYGVARTEANDDGVDGSRGAFAFRPLSADDATWRLRHTQWPIAS